MTPEIVVRIAEMAVSRTPGATVASIGLGSCIGLALLDRDSPHVGLAHIMLPAAPEVGADTPARYADLAVPELVAQLARLGTPARRLEAALVGGARMFASASPSALDIGARNEQATRDALAAAGIPVRATATGGTGGRTVRVSVDDRTITVRAAGGETRELYRVRPGRVTV